MLTDADKNRLAEAANETLAVIRPAMQAALRAIAQLTPIMGEAAANITEALATAYGQLSKEERDRMQRE